MFKKFRWKAIYRYLCRSSKNPESLARGLGIGIFIGFIPAIGFQMLLAAIVAGFFNANRLAAASGTLITNPVTAIPVTALSLWLGDWLLPGSRLANFSFDQIRPADIFEFSEVLGPPYLVGCLTLALGLGFMGYLATRLFYLYRQPSRVSVHRD